MRPFPVPIPTPQRFALLGDRFFTLQQIRALTNWPEYAFAVKAQVFAYLL